MDSDVEIARRARMLPVNAIGEKLGIPADALIPYGHSKAKIAAPYLKALGARPDGDLVLVTAMNPTPAGEGKTTTTVGLGDALTRIGKRAVIALREPSLGPCFGQKGGATGGGYAQVVPMDDINLHFTGDFHAITAAHNLLAAMLDNHIHWGNALGIDVRRIRWRRALDVNDRNLRELVTGMGGPANGVPAQGGFDITVASEVMAILCLADDLADLKARLARIIVAETRERKPVTAGDLKADGAMAVLLKDALLPNLVQTMENTPAIVHLGPFANIAHGCNSVAATRAALKLGDIVVTEAGFGADLGAQKFFDIKCRLAGLKPRMAVLVATIRSMKMNGGVAKGDLGKEDIEALQRGAVNVQRHIENLRGYGLPVIVALNHFTSDTQAEVDTVKRIVGAMGTQAIVCRHWADGGKGAEELAHAVVAQLAKKEDRFAVLYDDALPLLDKIETTAKRIYRASGVSAPAKVTAQLKRWEEAGYGRLPVCIAKTQYSFSTDPTKLGAPEGHVLDIREVRLAAGAGFVVAICGDLMTMPGLPRQPAAELMSVDVDGNIHGLS
ncbi:MAG: formate--tetrahydrofolate ligase [Alphaproteobacteria bacterium 32-64-14]|nr:MAG: formate--tetrahydrofolate ligase [Alphaproteobacteria bacterium 32-64-14]